MKKFLICVLSLSVIFLTGCGGETQAKNSPPADGSEKFAENTLPEKVNLKIGDEIFAVTLENNSAAQAFAKILPLEEEFEELNGNEKYFRLPEKLPANDFRPGEIHAGDLMLYNSSYIVIFYKDFSSNYPYTRLGKIENPAGLTKTVGKGNIKINFEK